METGEHHPKEPVVKQPSRISSVLRAITALTFIGGGAGELVSHHSADASASGGNSWGVRTEQPQQINPTETPEATIIETTPTPPAETTPTPTSEKTIDGSWSATPSPETPTPTPSPIIGEAWFSTPRAMEMPAELPQTGGAVSENQNGGIKDKLMLALGTALSGLGIGIANKQRSSQK